VDVCVWVIEVAESVVLDDVEDVNKLCGWWGVVVSFSVGMRKRMVLISGYEEEREILETFQFKDVTFRSSARLHSFKGEQVCEEKHVISVRIWHLCRRSHRSLASTRTDVDSTPFRLVAMPPHTRNVTRGVISLRDR
jgi:phosphoribosyl-AMP cyclohydrolase